MFGGHIHCGNGDIMVLVYQVISRDHVIKGPCDFMGKDHEGKLAFCKVCWEVHHVILQNHMIKE